MKSLAVLLFVAPSIAFASEPEATEVYAKKTIVEFSEVALSGQVVGPEHSYVLGRNRTRFPLLLRVRVDFRPELEGSLDAL